MVDSTPRRDPRRTRPKGETAFLPAHELRRRPGEKLSLAGSVEVGAHRRLSVDGCCSAVDFGSAQDPLVAAIPVESVI